MARTYLSPAPLTAAAFAQFGEVIELDPNHLAQDNAVRVMQINEGLTQRYHALASIDSSDEAGRPIISLFHSQAMPMPHRVLELERHPLGSQAFVPLDDAPFYVLVAPAQKTPNTINANDLKLFITNGKQGINFFKNTWHHYQIALGKAGRYIVVDRAGNGENLQLATVQGEVWLKEDLSA